MSFLYPLFLAGVAAVALPIALHMIRRHTRQRVTFSSLMFLRATLPRFQSRSRLEHIPLLILRCLALGLLAFGFARPFMVRPVVVNAGRADRRTVLLLDTSASMRRAGLWARAADEARSVLADTGPADRLGVMSFDQTTQTQVGFEQWATMEPSQRAAITGQEIARLAPGWAATNLGQALVTAAEALEEDEVNDQPQSPSTRRVVLISDLQRGSRLAALRAYEWPQETELVVKTVSCPGTTNASLQWVTQPGRPVSGRPRDVRNVRVTNSPDATRDRFQLCWAAEATGRPSSPPVEVYVPAGYSVVMPAPTEPNQPAATQLVLTGDDQDFDNILYAAPHLRQSINVLYLGRDDPNDTQEMLYYVRRAFEADDAATARLVRRSGAEPVNAAELENTDWVIVTDVLDPQNIAPLRRYLESGRSLLLVMKSVESITALGDLTGVKALAAREAEADRYAMLDRMEFDHPLLKPFSDPRFADFTRIHFWQHRRVDIAACPGARLLAKFDNDDPAWFEVPVGKGALLVWTSGWHPADSDLALSSKFVPLLYGALESGGTLADRQTQYFVGDPVPLPSQVSSPPADVQVRKPDGSVIRLTDRQQTFTQTDQPGVYAIVGSARDDKKPSAGRPSQSFAINLPGEESRTEPMPLEDIEQLGVSLAPAAGTTRERAAQTTRHDSFGEMESEQRLWRWVLLALLGVLLIETWLAGWLTRPAAVSEGEHP